MRMTGTKTCKCETGKISKNSRNIWILFTMLWALFFLTACSSRETVLLEEDDLVWTEEAQPSNSEDEPSGLEAELSDSEAEPPGLEGAAGGLERAGQGEMSTLFVHICGEVVKPGVYELPEGSRIFDAVEAAGGFTQEAYESYVNLAQVLADGWKVEIPKAGTGTTEVLGAPKTPGNGAEAGTGTSGTDAGAVCHAGPGSMAGITGNSADMEGGAGAGDGLVDINTATKQELCTLPGVGESRAESIISYREKNGGFGRIEDIMKVEGIKEGMFSKMKDKICVRGGK